MNAHYIILHRSVYIVCNYVNITLNISHKPLYMHNYIYKACQVEARESEGPPDTNEFVFTVDTSI